MSTLGTGVVDVADRLMATYGDEGTGGEWRGLSGLGERAYRGKRLIPHRVTTRYYFALVLIHPSVKSPATVNHTPT